MKKVFLFLSAISFVAISSCSDDENPVTPPVGSEDVLVKRVVMQQDDPAGFNYVIDYTYNGNKLNQAVYDDGYTEKYYYTGDKITKIDYIFEGVVEDQELFTYDSQGRLIDYRYQMLLEDFEERSIYVHNSDNTITETYISGSLGNPSTTGDERTLTMQNGEVSQIVHLGGSTYTYTYDTKNSPFKNVTGYAAISHAYAGDYELHGQGRNIVSIVNETENQNYTVNTIQYNADNYPTSISSSAIFDSNSAAEELTTTYIYE